MTSTPTVPPDSPELQSLGDGRGWLPCQQIDPDTFFPPAPSPGQNDAVELTQTAKWMCGGCPIRDACLQLALRTRQGYGIWGGKTVRERMAIARTRRQWRHDPSAVAS